MAKWTEAQREKFIATMAAKRKSKTKRPYRRKDKPAGDLDDVRIYLRHAVRKINSHVAAGGKEDMAHLLTKLALKTLEGE